MTTESVECVLLDIVLSIRVIVAMTLSSCHMYISRDVTFVEDPRFFHNPSTQLLYDSTESSSLMCLPHLLASSNAAPAPSVPSHSPTTHESL